MHVRILGPVEVESGGETIAASANQRMLIGLLAAHAGRIVSSDVLVESLWGDEQPQNPSAALQNLVSRVRTRLDPDDLAALVTRPPGYGLELVHATVDRLEFERLVAAARGESVPARAAELLRSALALWRGPAYAHVAECDALRADAVRLEEMRENAQEQLLRHMVRLDPRACVPELEAMVAASPYRDGPHMLLMEALYRSQRRRDALHAADRYRTMLADELGLDPSPELRELEHAILTDTLGTVTPRTSDDAVSEPRTDNLPLRRSSFVGRDREIEVVTALLDAHPAVTLVGVGGTGKTSLAIEAARAAVERFADGAWVIDLAALGDSARLAEHVAATIPGITPLPDADPLAALAGQLRGRTLLVVLDNCEHVVDAAARLVDCVLDRAPDVCVLATSREPLRIRGEHVHRVEPLDVPEPGADLAAVLASPAGRLLVDRILAADSAFDVEESDAATIIAISRRLDGLPLAVEIAAARVPAIGMAELAGRLDDRFSVLTNNQRGAVAHHRTLRAAIDWSVDLLDDDERALLARVSVFVGSFDLDAAEAVGANADVASMDVAGLLAVLVERSLVVSFRVDRVVRFRLLETIRQYSDDMLGQQRRSTQRAHRDWYLGVAREAGDGFLVQTARWSQRLREDFPNLRAAYQYSMENDEVAKALDLASSLRWALFNTGHLYGEHRRWIEDALRVAQRTKTPAEVLGRGLVSAGSVALLEGRSDDAVALLTEALDLLESLGAENEIVWCEMWLGAVCTDLAQFVGGVDHAERGLAAAESSEVPAAIVYLANQHAENALAAGLLLPDPTYLDTARASLHRAIDVATRHGIEEGLVRAEHGLALLESASDPVAGFRRCRTALDQWRRLGGGLRLIIGLVASARSGAMAGEEQVALDLLVEAADEMDRVGWRQAFGRLLETAALLALRRDLVEESGVLAGGASTRYLTPRWLVLLPFDEETTAARAADPVRWDRSVALGRTLDDDALTDVVRSIARSNGRR